MQEGLLPGPIILSFLAGRDRAAGRTVLVLLHVPVPIPIPLPSGWDSLIQPEWQCATTPSRPVPPLAGNTGAAGCEVLGKHVAGPGEPKKHPVTAVPRGSPGGRQSGSSGGTLPLAP